MRLNGKQFEEVGCFKYTGLQVAADRRREMDIVQRMNKGYERGHPEKC